MIGRKAVHLNWVTDSRLTDRVHDKTEGTQWDTHLPSGVTNLTRSKFSAPDKVKGKLINRINTSDEMHLHFLLNEDIQWYTELHRRVSNVSVTWLPFQVNEKYCHVNFLWDWNTQRGLLSINSTLPCHQRSFDAFVDPVLFGEFEGFDMYFSSTLCRKCRQHMHSRVRTSICPSSFLGQTFQRELISMRVDLNERIRVSKEWSPSMALSKNARVYWREKTTRFNVLRIRLRCSKSQCTHHVRDDSWTVSVSLCWSHAMLILIQPEGCMSSMLAKEGDSILCTSKTKGIECYSRSRKKVCLSSLKTNSILVTVDRPTIPPTVLFPFFGSWVLLSQNTWQNTVWHQIICMETRMETTETEHVKVYRHTDMIVMNLNDILRRIVFFISIDSHVFLAENRDDQRNKKRNGKRSGKWWRTRV